MSTKAIRQVLERVMKSAAARGEPLELLVRAESELEKLEAACVFIATVDDEHTNGSECPPEVAAEAAKAYDLFHQVAVEVAERKRS